MMGYCTIIFALLSFVSICNTTLLWRINVNPPAYLLGTAHLPHTYIWSSISDTAKSAFDNCTHFLPEFDMTNFFTFTRFRMCMNSYMANNGNSPSSPAMRQLVPETSILDTYLVLEARRLKKTVLSLESVEMYCEFTKFQLDSLITNITSTGVKSPLPSENDFGKVKHAYNCDFNYPGELFPPTPTNMGDKTFLAFQQRLNAIVDRRDSGMAKMIDSLLKERSPTNRYFFAVGYIHLMGFDGIVAKLRKDYKYSVTRLCTDPPGFRAGLMCEAPSWCDITSGF